MSCLRRSKSQNDTSLPSKSLKCKEMLVEEMLVGGYVDGYIRGLYCDGNGGLGGLEDGKLWVSFCLLQSRMSNTSDKGTTFGDGVARVGMQLRSSPKVSTSSPLVSPSSIINVPRELYSIDVAATFGVPLTTVGDLQKLINDIDAGKHNELLYELLIKIVNGLSEQQKKRKAQVQFEAQFYTEEDWDTIRAKLEANAELSKDVLGQDLPEQDFAKRMVDMVNQRKKHFAEERAKAKRNKPMTQSQLRIYMSNYLKNQGTWKLSQLKKLKFEEIKEEFDKLVQQIDTFVPINLEATKAKLKRYGEELQTKTSKKQKIDDKDVPAIGEKVAEVKEEEQKYGTNRPEDAYDRVLWSDLRTMFNPPLIEDAIWSLPPQQKMVSWRYYDKCEVHCLTLEACTIYMLADKKYPLSKEACQVMMKMKLLDGKMNEVCYKLLKMIEKQAGIRK
ncbi:hypothetical protein Tco_0245950 [Tanacetum coccineum]